MSTISTISSTIRNTFLHYNEFFPAICAEEDNNTTRPNVIVNIIVIILDGGGSGSGGGRGGAFSTGITSPSTTVIRTVAATILRFLFSSSENPGG